MVAAKTFVLWFAVLPSNIHSLPLRIFILAGQSNVGGYADLGHLEELAADPSTSPIYQAARTGSSWTVRDDVFVRFNDDTRQGNLTAEYGSSSGRFGPELSMGFVLGDYFDEPVLLVKVAFGGTSLAVDWRPPSSPPSIIPYSVCNSITGGCSAIPDQDYGTSYRSMLRIVDSTIEDLPTIVPSFEGTYEISGFVWFQGFNDVIDTRKIDEYEQNLSNLIRDVRSDLDSPDLPFIIGELGMQGPVARDRSHRELRIIQESVSQHHEFKEYTSFVPTSPYTLSTSPAYDGESHYFGRGDTMWSIGEAFGYAIVEEIFPSPTTSPLPSTEPTTAPSSSPSTPYPSSYPTAPPSSVPTPTDGVCDDDNNELFYVPDLNQNQRCIWLAARPTYQASMCVAGNIVYDICEETCGKCKDLCDDTSESFTVDGLVRNCAWLSIRFSMQDRICVASHDAFSKCPETCNSCPSQTMTPTERPSILLGVVPVEVPTENLMSPSAKPSLSLYPSERPVSESPTTMPSDKPSLSVSPSQRPVSNLATTAPSGTPSLSLRPSKQLHTSFAPGQLPSYASYPVLTQDPSASMSMTESPITNPATSMFPTESSYPIPDRSERPSASLDISYLPSLSPSEAPALTHRPAFIIETPSVMPSSRPSQTAFPSLHPSHAPESCRDLREDCAEDGDCCSGVCHGSEGLPGRCHRSAPGSKAYYKLGIVRGGASGHHM